MQLGECFFEKDSIMHREEIVDLNEQIESQSSFLSWITLSGEETPRISKEPPNEAELERP